MPRPPRFTIRAASALTGINQNTLRAWERRYGLISPERTPKGYRLYSDEDLERLRLIRRAMHEGVPVGRVGEHLLKPGVVEHLRDGDAPAAAEAVAGPAPLADCRARIERAARGLDLRALERAYHDTVGMYPVREAFREALGPALRCMCPHGGVCDPAERLLTVFARERLGEVLAGLRPLHQQPRALFACAPGESEEVPLMLLSLDVGLEGVSALYLGAGTAMEAVHETAAAAGSRAVVLSACAGLPQDEVLGLRDRLAGLPHRPRLLVEGRAARERRDWLESVGVETLPAAYGEAVRQVLRAAAAA